MTWTKEKFPWSFFMKKTKMNYEELFNQPAAGCLIDIGKSIRNFQLCDCIECKKEAKKIEEYFIPSIRKLAEKVVDWCDSNPGDFFLAYVNEHSAEQIAETIGYFDFDNQYKKEKQKNSS